GGVGAALVGVALPAPGPVGGLGVRLLPLEPPRRGGEALQRGLERPLAALAPRPQALLHPQRLGGGELEGEPLDRRALRAGGGAGGAPAGGWGGPASGGACAGGGGGACRPGGRPGAWAAGRRGGAAPRPAPRRGGGWRGGAGRARAPAR